MYIVGFMLHLFILSYSPESCTYIIYMLHELQYYIQMIILTKC
jgi:hypothetical protein